MHSYTDLLILLFVSFAIGCLFSSTWSSTNAHEHKLVVQSAGSTQKINLQQNGIYTIDSLLGSSEIEVKNSSARFIKSECNNKICIQNGWLSTIRPIIACIPNGVSIQMNATTKSRMTFDAFAF
jgi:hypothetical protein